MMHNMHTFRLFLAARSLSEYLLIKYGEEVSQPKRLVHTEIGIHEEFKKLADALGYEIVEKHREAAE
jgi:hypothetical protein